MSNWIECQERVSAGVAAGAAARVPRYWQTASSAESGLRSDLAPGLGAHGSLGCSPVAGHPTTESSPLSHSTTGTPVQENWSGDDWMSDFKEANHDAYFAPAYYEIPRQGSSRESVLMQGVNAVNAFGDAFSSGARGMVHELARHPVQSTVNVLKGLASLGEAAYDLGNEISHIAGLPASTAAIARNHAREIGVVNAYHAESRAFRTGTVVQDAAMLGSAALFVAESLGAGGALPAAGRLAFNASRLGRVGLFGQQAVDGSRLLSRVDRISSNLINQQFISEEAVSAGWKPPYPDNLSLRKITTAQELKFYRVHVDPDRIAGRFLVREKEIARFLHDPEALRLHLGLPDVPIYITEVNVPARTQLLVGRIGAQPSFGLMEESGFQYQAIKELPKSSFVNTRLLVEPKLNFGKNY